MDAASKLVSDLTEIELLNGRDGGRFLSELVNRPGLPWDSSVGSGMNWSLAVSELDAERRFLRLDGEPVILYSLLSPPATARANMLNDLYRLDARMTVSLEWRPYTTEAGRKKINSARKHYFSQRYSMMAHVQETEGSASAMEDSVASAESDRLSKALVELETDGIAYGDVSLSIALHGELAAIERLDGDVRRIFATHDAKLIREGYGQLAQWFNRMPGQPRSRQLRKVLVSAGAAASLAPLFGPPRGTEQSAHLGAPALTTLETHWQTPFFYDLFAGDVGHTLILGATGAGKSFTLNFLLVQALQYRPRVLILDLGRKLSLAHTLPWRGLPGTLARRGPIRGCLPVAAVQSPAGRTHLPVPDRLGHAIAPARGHGNQRRRSHRDPQSHRRSLCLSPGPARPDRAGPILAQPHVGRDGTLARARAPGPGISTTRPMAPIWNLPTGK